MGHTLTPVQQEAQHAWVTSSGASESAAWNAMYDSLYPRPAAAVPSTTRLRHCTDCQRLTESIHRTSCCGAPVRWS